MNTNINNPGASATAIQHHYDLSNDFYKLWLDPTCTYSCAMWQEEDDLTSAQLRKIDFHINNCKAKEGDLILDIGCGCFGEADPFDSIPLAILRDLILLGIVVILHQIERKRLSIS